MLSVFFLVFVDRQWKLGGQLQRHSEDEIQQEVVETATTDFLGRQEIEDKDRYDNSLLDGALVR
jgi:hypothetical protein